MGFSITTWNINSVRLRMPIIEQFVMQHQPDIICLQETKVRNDLFPLSPLRALGYDHIIIHGQKGYHGVAIASRIPLAEDHRQDYCGIGDARHISAIFERVPLYSRLDLTHLARRPRTRGMPAGRPEKSISMGGSAMGFRLPSTPT